MADELVFEGASLNGDELIDTPAGCRALAYLDALESGDPDRIRAAIEEHYHPAFLDRLPSPLYLNAYVGQQMPCSPTMILRQPTLCTLSARRW